ncbi:MAG: carboxypeptidase-like regulatory domain-containing protein [Luteibaculaceae bacterium]
MSTYLSALFLFLACLAYGQNEIAIIVVDAQDEKPIENVHILVHNKFGVLTNKNGQAIFKLENLNLNDTLLVSHIAYEKQQIVIKSNSNQKITLQKRNNLLTEVAIKPKEEFFIGNMVKRNSTYLAKIGTEVVLKIEEYNLQQLSFVDLYILKTQKLKTPFEIVIYKADTAGGIGEKVIFDDSICSAYKKGWNRFYIRNLGVQTQTFFIGVKWLSTDENGYYYLSKQDFKSDKSNFGIQLGLFETKVKQNTDSFIRQNNGAWSRFELKFKPQDAITYINPLIVAGFN